MIIVQLLGGLGNQMFQYALGRRLSIDRQTTLKLDTSSFQRDTLRKFHLNHFEIHAEIATTDESLRFSSQRIDQRLKRLTEKLTRPYFDRRLVYERTPAFDPHILRVKNDVYLRGYWQNEQYFAPIQSEIRSEFTLRTSPPAASLELVRRMADVNSVSLHIRRGDYASNPITNQHHGLLPLRYYEAAVDLIASKVSRPHFYVFSDDLDWANDHLRLGFETIFVDINGADQAHEDLRLMSMCHHHIIANSSFSWWGAWLSQYPDQCVIAPSKWLADPVINACYTLPSRWQRLAV